MGNSHGLDQICDLDFPTWRLLVLESDIKAIALDRVKPTLIGAHQITWKFIYFQTSILRNIFEIIW